MPNCMRDSKTVGTIRTGSDGRVVLTITRQFNGKEFFCGAYVFDTPDKAEQSARDRYHVSELRRVNA